MSTYSEMFEAKVRLWLVTKYEVAYTGSLHYTVDTTDTPYHYKLTWGLNQETYPFVMQGQFVDEDSFYNYVVKQIALTKFFETKRFIARRTSPPEFIVKDFKDPLLTFYEPEQC